MSAFSILRPALAAVLLTITVTGQAQAPRPPVAAFFESSPFSSPVLSPNGKLLAFIVGTPGRRDALVVVDLAANKIHPTARYDDVDIGRVQWVNNQRLIYDTTKKEWTRGDVDRGPGLFAIDYDGKQPRQLARRDNDFVREASAISSRMLPYHTYLMERPGAQDSDWVYVKSLNFASAKENTPVDLVHVNTVTGETKGVGGPPGNPQGWVLDHTGAPRIVATLEREMTTIYQRDREAQAWKELVKFDAFKSPSSFYPLAFGGDGTFYAIANGGKDKSAVHTVNMNTGAISAEPLISMTDYDFDGSLIFSQGKLLGFKTTADATSTMWVDAHMKKVQGEIDAKLTGTMNLVSVPTRPETPWVLVKSYSDVQPAVYSLYNTETKAFNLIGSSRPAIVPAQMGKQQVVTYKARDGMSIPALLTMPRGDKKTGLPMVVLVHGGPWVRGSSWGWDEEAQFLASRGYVVLQPDFRGSTGYGGAHYRAGFKQWGLAMQHDLADGAKWAIAKGFADPTRICIAGASYGGYATLMGLVNDPDLYKCGVNWVGVTDINLMYNDHWLHQSDLTDSYRKYGMPDMIGDQVKDAAQLKATSPVEQAARIKQPLLMAYGDHDQRVPISHGKQFLAAVRAHNKDVEWVVYTGEGHGWRLAENRIDFWTRVEKFLDKHIGKP
ncbi:MAG: prolyl oligopeptidase family serine peptidase [Pseudomonadota bacterium]